MKALVKSKSPIKILNLSGNEITPSAAKEIIELSKSIKTLQVLKIELNCFGSKFDEMREYAGDSSYVDFGNER